MENMSEFTLETKPFLLVCILQESLEVRTHQETARDGQGLARQRRIAMAQDGWVSYRPGDWVKDCTAEDRKDCNRGLKELEAENLVEVMRDKRNRPLWARVTEEGERRAREIGGNVRAYFQELPPPPLTPRQQIEQEIEMLRKANEKNLVEIADYERRLELCLQGKPHQEPDASHKLDADSYRTLIEHFRNNIRGRQKMLPIYEAKLANLETD